MEEFYYQLQQIYGMTGVPNSVWENGVCVFSAGERENNPVSVDEGFRALLMERGRGKKVPAILLEQNQICFCCFYRGEVCCIIGPVIFHSLSRTALHQFYRRHGMKLEVEKPLPLLGFSKTLSMLKLAAHGFCGEMYGDQVLMEENGLSEWTQERHEESMLRFTLNKEEEEEFHHTYREEQALLECVREGRTDDALRLNMQMDNELGRMSQNEEMQWRKLVTVAITLCTRAAIEGGLSPGQAYTLSDYYIQQSDACKDVPSLVACRNRAVENLCEQVRKKHDRPRYSNYVEQCRDYVEKHYREKILLEELAEKMGLSPTYLSRLFSREMGVRLQDYIVQFRVERAANLLVYSEESIARIGEYVNFPSQSYFGKMFKKYKHMTPKAYRDEHKPREFIE